MKILHFYYRFQMGGSENLTLAILNNDKKNQHLILVLQKKNDYQFFVEKKYGLKIVNIFSKTNSIFSYKNWYGSYKEIKKFSPDIIHAYMFDASQYGRVIGFFLRIPTIIYVVNSYKSKIFKRGIINKILSFSTQHIIACSLDVKNDIIKYDGIDPSKISVISSFATFDFEADFSHEIRSNLQLNNEDYLGLFIARLVEQKGIEYLIKAVDLCVNIWKMKEIKVAIVGDGPLKDEISKMIKSYSLTKHIFLMGELRNLNPILTEADFYIDSSVWAGLSVASIKALEAGLPIIMTNVGGANELSNNGEFASLVEPKNPKALASEIEVFFRSRKEKNNLQRLYALDHFSDKKAVRNIIKIYNKALHL